MSNGVVTILPYAGGVAGLSVAAVALLNYRRDAAGKDVTRASVLVDSMARLNDQLEKSLIRAEAALERVEETLERVEEALERSESREDALTKELRSAIEQGTALRDDVARLETLIGEMPNGTG